MVRAAAAAVLAAGSRFWTQCPFEVVGPIATTWNYNHAFITCVPLPMHRDRAFSKLTFGFEDKFFL